MPYTPVFQPIIDELDIMVSQKRPISILREWFKDQMIKIGPKERIDNLYKIRPKRAVPGERSRYISFRRNKMQNDLWEHRTNRDSILKMRQGGITSDSCITALDMCLFNNSTNACIMAEVLGSVKKYFRITKNAFNQFQKDWGELYPVTNTVDNVAELHIGETGSILMVATETKGLTLDFLHISEAAFVEDKRIEESIESVPLSGRVIMESTADGASGIFYNHWNTFLTNVEKALFECHFYEWWWLYPELEDIPYLKRPRVLILDEKEQQLMDRHNLTEDHIIFRRNKIAESGSEAEFLKKYPEDPITCFLCGAHSVFNADVVRGLWMNSKDASFKGDLRIST